MREGRIIKVGEWENKELQVHKGRREGGERAGRGLQVRRGEKRVKDSPCLCLACV